MVVVEATFVHEHRALTAQARVLEKTTRRCSLESRYVIDQVRVVYPRGLVVEPVEGSGLYRAAFEALARKVEER